MIKVLVVKLTRPYIEDYIEHWIDDFKDSLKKVGLNIEVLLWPETIRVPMKCFDWSRNQYFAPCILSFIKEQFKELINEYHIIGVGYIDAYDRGLNFVFGEADPYNRVAVVFTVRLDPRFYDEGRNYNLYVERVSKEIVHEFGHLLGLRHCNVRKCVMSFSNNVYEVDLKTRFFCNNCRRKLNALMG
ncbi:MAG: peptidase M54 [Desulfurococcales archaeon ex4484_58]|nr:MAG: peptidase M54 [Desulfurococcales archaeon ex4484_58]